MDNQQERLIKLAWLAGAWEADGSFQLNKNNLRRQKTWQLAPACGFTNTDIEFVAEVIGILKSNGLAYHQFNRIQTGFGTKIRAEIRVIGIKRVQRFLTLLIPFLKSEKKYEAQLILDFCNLRLSLPKGSNYTDKEYKIYERFLHHQKLRKNGKLESPTTNTLNAKG